MKTSNLFEGVYSLKLATTTALPGQASPASFEPASLTALFTSSGGSGDEPKRTVRAGRRRDVEPAGPEGRERAEAPKRQPTPDQSPAGPPSGSGAARPPTAPPPAGASLPGGRMSPVMIGIVAVIFICLFLAITFLGGGDNGESRPAQPEPAIIATAAEPALPTATARPAIQPPATEALLQAPLPTASRPSPGGPPATSGESWTVMLYQDADDKILEQDIYVDLNEAERVGSSDAVKIVAQVDRFRGGYRGDGDWSDTRRFLITRDDDLQRVDSQQVQNLGEVNMSDGQTLVDFVTWAVENYPADRYALIMSDHGMGWPGGWSDSDPASRGDRRIPLASALGDQLYLDEIDAALAQIRAQTGLDKLDLIGMDACLMGHIEVLSALAPHARYAVVSQETEPALGWAYTSFLTALNQNPAMDGGQLGRLIVESYIQGDQRIVDDQARAELVGRGSPLGSLFGGPTAAQVAEQLERNITLTAADLSAMPGLTASLNNLALQLQQVRQEDVAKARTYAQSFTSIFGKDVPPSYIDLGSFAQILKQVSRGDGLAEAADGVLAAIGQAVIAEKHGPNKPGASGVSVYFPNSQLFGNPAAGPQSYTVVAERFVGESLWDDFLAYHYTGRAFDPIAAGAVIPEQGAAVRGPGQGEISISAIEKSGDVAGPGRPVLFSADVSGDNIGYIRFFVGFFDPQGRLIFVADQDYLESGDTREVDGVYYPDWGEGDFTLEFEWEPLMFAISDGANQVTAALAPQSYGASSAEAIYTVDGLYTYVDGEERYARLYFQDGQLRQVFGFTGQGGEGAPREILPQTGDSFTVLETWLDLDADGQVSGPTSQSGGTLTFGEQMFTWEALDAAVGDYVFGFSVSDLDGNTQEAYTQVAVE